MINYAIGTSELDELCQKVKAWPAQTQIEFVQAITNTAFRKKIDSHVGRECEEKLKAVVGQNKVIPASIKKRLGVS